MLTYFLLINRNRVEKIITLSVCLKSLLLEPAIPKLGIFPISRDFQTKRKKGNFP